MISENFLWQSNESCIWCTWTSICNPEWLYKGSKWKVQLQLILVLFTFFFSEIIRNWRDENFNTTDYNFNALDSRLVKTALDVPNMDIMVLLILLIVNNQCITIVSEIVVDTSSGTGSLSKDSQTCILCEFVMTNLDKIIKDKKTEEEIKHAVHSVCRVMPKSIKQVIV